jgi:1,4-alpha-glucan branching enzyme
LDLVFIFNFHPNKSFTDYGILTEPGRYELILNSDDKQYGGFGLVEDNQTYFTMETEDETLPKDKAWLQLYIPSRTALVLRKVE